MTSTKDSSHSLISHLIALRRCLIRACISFFIVFFALVYWAPHIFRLFALPLLDVLPKGAHMIVTDVVGSFLIPMKVTFLVAFVLALPYMLYQAWLFIAPGLYHHEKRWILPLVISSYLLFLVGMAFAYFFVFPNVFQFIVQYNAPLGVQMATDIEKYLDFAMTMFLVFGVSFEMPIVVVALVALNVVSRPTLLAVRPYVVVGSFIIAAILTPPDVLSQLLLGIPLCILFELGLLASRWFIPRQ